MTSRKLSLLVGAAMLVVLIPVWAAIHFGKETDVAKATSTGKPYSTGTTMAQTPFRTHDKCVDAEEACLPPDAPPVLPLAGARIMLDPGHGGSDYGAIRDGINEKDINLGVALKVREALIKQGATVLLTRQDDSTMTLEERIVLIAKHAPTMFLSIHTNAHTNSVINGIEAYYFNDASQSLAQSVYQAVVDGLGERGNWVRKRELAVVHHELAPAALIEIGYLSNTNNRSFLVNEDYQVKVAASIYKGILDFISTQRANAGQPAQKPAPGESPAPGSALH